MIIAIDFDGTCVAHDYPNIGKDIGAVPVIKDWVQRGHKIILLTMRDGKEFEAAKNWFKTFEIPLYGANENPDQKNWVKTNKIFANMYIDDAALGCPLRVDPMISIKPFVDWNQVKIMFDEIENGIKPFGNTTAHKSIVEEKNGKS